MGTLGWIISLGSGAGLAGYVALLFFAPQAAVAIERIALDILKRILSTRLGCAALTALVVGIAAYFYGDHHGAARVQAEWDAAEHAAIAAGQEAREEAEREIAPVADAPPTETPSADAPPADAPASPLIPFLNPKVSDACPEPPRRRAPRARPDDERLRLDPHNRDHH